jgi:glycosyltransferase involved in cell wall biosynthesis
MGEPRLTVAMPVKDGENYIREALDSILGQSFGDFKVLIAENASTDATNDILADYAQRDRRLTFHSDPVPMGHTPNFNRVMRLCDTPWVKLICHDDLLRADTLAQVDAAIEVAAENNVGLISNGNRLLVDDARITPGISGQPRRLIKGHDAIRMFLSGNDDFAMPAVSNCAVRKDVWEKAGGFDERFLHQDIPAWLYGLTECNLFYLPDTLTVVRVHPGQITNVSHRTAHTVHDFRIFVEEFIPKYGDMVGIDAKTRLRARLRPLSNASLILGRLASAGNWKGFAQVLGGVPKTWWPFLPIAIVRKRRMEIARHADAMATIAEFDAVRESVPVRETAA